MWAKRNKSPKAANFPHVNVFSSMSVTICFFTLFPLQLIPAEHVIPLEAHGSYGQQWMNRSSHHDGKTETHFVPHSFGNVFTRTETRLTEEFEALWSQKRLWSEWWEKEDFSVKLVRNLKKRRSFVSNTNDAQNKNLWDLWLYLVNEWIDE